MLDEESSNASRVQLIERIRTWASEKPKAAAGKAAAQNWASDQSLQLALALKKPQAAEKDVLVSMARNNGGIKFLKDRYVHARHFCKLHAYTESRQRLACYPS